MTLNSTGYGWTVSGDGTLSGSSGPTVTLTAGGTAGAVTVSIGRRGKVCTENSIYFTVVSPSAVLYEAQHPGHVYHSQGIANIGIYSNVYLAPDSVSFQNTQFEELDAYASSSGAWACINGSDHELHPTPVQVGQDVPGYGSKIEVPFVDQAYSGSCSGNQLQQSVETYDIPTEYSVDGAWHQIGTVVQQETETAAGALSIAKDHATGNSTVDSPSSSY